MKGDAKALTPRLVTEAKNGSVVTSDLGTAGTVGSRAVKVLQDESVHGVNTVVDTSGHDEDDESVLLRRAQTELCRAAEEERTNVHGRACAVRRHVLGVQADGQLHAMLEVVDGDVGNGDGGRGVLHALSVLLGTEDVDGLVVRGAVGLQSLVALLAVVETRCHAVDAHEG